MTPAPERVGLTLQLPSGPILHLAPGEAMLEELGQFRQLAERPGLRAQHLLLLQLPAAGFHPSRRSSRHHPSTMEWIPWPSSPPVPPPPSPSSFGRGAGWSGPQRPPLRRSFRLAGPLQEAEDETRRSDTFPEQSKRL